MLPMKKVVFAGRTVYEAPYTVTIDGKAVDLFIRVGKEIGAKTWEAVVGTHGQHKLFVPSPLFHIWGPGVAVYDCKSMGIAVELATERIDEFTD